MMPDNGAIGAVTGVNPIGNGDALDLIGGPGLDELTGRNEDAAGEAAISDRDCSPKGALGIM